MYFSVVPGLFFAFCFLVNIVPAPPCRMPSRSDKHFKSCRWILYLEHSSAKRVLRDVAEDGNSSRPRKPQRHESHNSRLLGREHVARITFHDLGPCKVELAWNHAVTYQSVLRLINQAKDKDTSFRTAGAPVAVLDDEAEPAEPPDEVEEQTQKKRLRLVGKTSQPPAAAPQTPALATRKTPRTPALQAATAQADSAYCLKSNDKVQAAPLNSSAPPEPVACWLLSLKTESMVTASKEHLFGDGPPKYQIDLKTVLGEGSFGTVYKGLTACELQQPVAIKVVTKSASGEQEVRRHVVCNSPFVVQLLDVMFVSIQGCNYLSLVFESYDLDLCGFLNKVSLKIAGMRHVLRCVLDALAYMHRRGVIHTDVKPPNILLRGTPLFTESWRRLLSTPLNQQDEPPEVLFHLPALFQVCFWEPPFKPTPSSVQCFF